MEVRLTPDQEAFVRQAIESGRFHRAEDAVEEALLLSEERDRKRAEFFATLDDAKAVGEGFVPPSPGISADCVDIRNGMPYPSSFRDAKCLSAALSELIACGVPPLDILIGDLERKASRRRRDD
jgi:putative addiction module CopG family antidote